MTAREEKIVATAARIAKIFPGGTIGIFVLDIGRMLERIEADPIMAACVLELLSTAPSTVPFDHDGVDIYALAREAIK